jgi:hypothetical protein
MKSASLTKPANAFREALIVGYLRDGARQSAGQSSEAISTWLADAARRRIRHLLTVLRVRNAKIITC